MYFSYELILFKDKDQPSGNIPEEVFKVYAEDDNVIDARDLRDMLNAVFRKGTILNIVK